MAELIGITSGLLALTVFTFNSCSTLYRTVKSVQNHPGWVLDLIEELGAFIAILENLQNAVDDDSTDLVELKGPLLTCGNACDKLTVEITKRTSHTSNGKTSIRDWAKIKFMGNDIVTFQDMIARYKSTIMIALCGANLRTATATASALDEYQEFITKTMLSLNKYFQEKDSRLQTLAVPGASLTNEDVSEKERLQTEMNTTKECLTICAKVFGDLDQVRLDMINNICAAHGLRQPNLTMRGDLASAKRIIINGCEDWKGAVARTASQLENHLFGVDSAPMPSFPGPSLVEDTSRGKQAQELDDSIRDCQKACAKAIERVEEARTNIVEDMSTGSDTFQIVVATFGDLLTARRVKVGDRSFQALGQMSEAALLKSLEVAGRPSSQTPQGSKQQAKDVAKFEDRYGGGYKICS